MTALKLESFSHDVEIRKGISKFESFEALRESAYNEGVKSGAEAASRAFEAEKIRTLAPILEALNDMAFSQVEARQAILASLEPMLMALVNAVLPAAARHGLAEELAALLATAYEKSPRARVVISVAPEAVGAIQAALAPAKADFTVEADPALTPLQARAAWQGGYDELNLDATLDALRAAIEQFFSKTRKTGTDDA